MLPAQLVCGRLFRGVAGLGEKVPTTHHNTITKLRRQLAPWAQLIWNLSRPGDRTPVTLSSNPSADPPTAGAQRIRAAGILALTVVAAVFLFARPAIPQSLAYHDFADQRALLGVPHFWNVVSNV